LLELNVTLLMTIFTNCPFT